MSSERFVVQVEGAARCWSLIPRWIPLLVRVQLLVEIQAAFEQEVATMTWAKPGMDPNGVPGQNGVCCDRAKYCYCV